MTEPASCIQCEGWVEVCLVCHLCEDCHDHAMLVEPDHAMMEEPEESLPQATR